MGKKLNKEDHVGKTFGFLTVLDIETVDKKLVAVCKCVCGSLHKPRWNDVSRGKLVSCGCKRPLLLKEQGHKHAKHYKTGTVEYNTWIKIKSRCHNPDDKDYIRYSSRGIFVCERWLDKKEGFKNFFDDMGPKPQPYKDYSIDRIDNNGPYSPENCRWATIKQQNNNLSSNRVIEYNGKSQTLTQWAEETGLTRYTISDRLERGWSLEKTLTTPPRKVGRRLAA